MLSLSVRHVNQLSMRSTVGGSDGGGGSWRRVARVEQFWYGGKICFTFIVLVLGRYQLALIAGISIYSGIYF